MSADDNVADAIADEIIRLLKQPNSIQLPEDVRISMAVCMAVDKYRQRPAYYISKRELLNEKQG